MQKKSHTPFFSPPADEKKAHCGPMTRREGDSKSWTKTKNARGEKKNLRGEKRIRVGKQFLCAGKQFLRMKKQTKREQTTTEPVHAEFFAVKKEIKAVGAEFNREEIKI